MPDCAWTPEPSNALLPLAVRYFEGELPESEAAAFELRLAGEQSAREALCEAVRLTAGMDGASELLPDRAYREGVRARLCSSAPPVIPAVPGPVRRVRARLILAASGACFLIAGGLLALNLRPAEPPAQHHAGRRHRVHVVRGNGSSSGGEVQPLTAGQPPEVRSICPRQVLAPLGNRSLDHTTHVKAQSE